MKIHNLFGSLKAVMRHLTLGLALSAGLVGVIDEAHAAPLTWDGNGATAPNPDGGTGTWNTNSNLNWWDGSTNVVWPALGGTDDDAIFADTAGTVTISGGVTANDLAFNTTGYTIQSSTLTLNGTTPTITVSSGTATISSAIAGSAGLTKNGAGILTLSGTNAFSGGVTISGGTLSTSAVGNIPSANSITLENGATWRSTANVASPGYANSLIVDAGDSGVFRNNSGNSRFSGNLSGVAGSLTIDESGATGGQGFMFDVAAADYGTAPSGSVITYLNSGANNVNPRLGTTSAMAAFANSKVVLTRTGAGTLTLILGITSGTGAQFGALDGGGAGTSITREGFGNGANVTTITINGTTDGNFAGAITTVPNLIKIGSSTQTLSGTNTYSGSTTINGGTLFTTAPASIPSASGVTITNGATWRIGTTGATYTNGLTIANGDSGIVQLASGTLNQNFQSNLSGVAGSLTLSTTIGGSSGGFILNGTSMGAAALGSVVTFSKGSNANNTIDRLATSSSFAALGNSKVVFNRTGGGTQQLLLGLTNSGTAQFGALDGGDSSTSIDADSIGTNTVSITINGTVDGNFAGNILGGVRIPGLTKNGSSTQTLSGVNTYAGTTTISGGTLLANTAVAGSNSATGTGAVTVGASGILGGTGQIRPGTGNNITVDGTLAPGASIGTLTINGGGTDSALLNMSSGAKFEFELGAAGLPFASPGTSDRLAITSAAASDVTFINNNIDILLTGGAGFYKLFDSDLATAVEGDDTWFGLTLGGVSGRQILSGLNVTNLTSGLTGTLFVGNGTTIGDAGDIYLNLQVVPEPSSFAMLLFGSVMLWFVGRKRS